MTKQQINTKLISITPLDVNGKTYDIKQKITEGPQNYLDRYIHLYVDKDDLKKLLSAIDKE